MALLATGAPERLSSSARSAIEEGPAFLSVITYWEVLLKAMKGLLDVGDPRQWWAETTQALALLPLAYRPEHIAAIYDLPSVHQDPFDRALIAQATVEELTLITKDALILKYASPTFRALR